jgi:uncharacterized protein YndB with AHSA1/START domain
LAPPAQQERRRVTLERTFQAPIEDVWELWTTKAGIEAWWGPEGFSVEVLELDLRPGGDLVYAMTAVAPDQVDFMRKAGMPVRTEHRLTFTEIVPGRLLGYLEQADFIPGVEPYTVDTRVELDVTPGGVRMTLTFEAMHDERWTQLAIMGRESELAKLARALDARARR